ncbi:MAG: citrate lyase acyl carrier protein [Eubacterium sp.]
MEIVKNAAAGTLESSDVFIAVEPAEELVLEIESVVLEQYGRAIKKTAEEVIDAFGITKGIIRINDRGALDCVLKARMETAFKRGAKP